MSRACPKLPCLGISLFCKSVREGSVCPLFEEFKLREKGKKKSEFWMLMLVRWFQILGVSHNSFRDSLCIHRVLFCTKTSQHFLLVHFLLFLFSPLKSPYRAKLLWPSYCVHSFRDKYQSFPSGALLKTLISWWQLRHKMRKVKV